MTTRNEPNTPLWIGTAGLPRFEPLSAPLHVDVAVIGGGITGITAALLLKERGKRVAVIERARVGGGETGHTTAHITEAIDARYHFIKRSFDKEAAQLVAQASRASIEQIAEFIRRYDVSCRFRRLPGYLYTEKRKYVAELKSEAVSAKEAGVNARWTTEVPLPFETRGAVVFEDQAQFHPGEYIAGLAPKIPGDGSHVFEETQVISIEEGEPCVVETDRGRVTADSVFMATNTPIAGFTTVHTRAIPYRTYAMAVVHDGEHPDGLFWDTADPYHYTRWQDEFLIVGGFDHKVGHEEDTEGSFARLAEYTSEYWGAKPLRYRWSGQVIEPVDGLPFIGGAGKLYCSTGYAGQGMTFGTVGGMLVADLITGRDNPWAKLFDPHRVHVRGAVKDFVTENVDFPKTLIRDALRRNVEGKETFDVKSGEGRILSIEGTKLAVYRDESGNLHALKPACTHMGCDVAWNDAEKSWDCPCHGSRFGVEGEVLNGPAHEGLEKVLIDE